MKELEKELGLVLLYRGGKGVALTNDGAEFLLHAKEIYDQYEAVVQKYSKNGRLPKKIRSFYPTLFLCGESICGYGKRI